MNRLLTSIFFFLSISVFGQVKPTPIQVVDSIFKNYIKFQDNLPSQTEKDKMKHALIVLQQKINNKDLPILINVWMYFDPTDFPTRELIEPIFKKNKSMSISQIDKRIKNRMKNESYEIAPYSDLIALRLKLSR